jgi:DNA-binding NarL/FixJ family response regulator
MKHRILITDDDRFLMTAYRALLGRDDELAVDFASGPAQAHALMSTNDYELACFDIELSADEDGIDLLRDLRRNHPETSVLMMSTLDDEVTMKRCFAAGATAFASKNRDFLPGLTAKVHGMLAAESAARAG